MYIIWTVASIEKHNYRAYTLHTFRCVLSVTLNTVQRIDDDDDDRIGTKFSISLAYTVYQVHDTIFSTRTGGVYGWQSFFLYYFHLTMIYTTTRHRHESHMTQPTYRTLLLLYRLFWREYERPQNVIQ